MLDLVVGFAIIIILIRKKIQYGISMIAGALAIALFAGLGIDEYVVIARNTFQYSTLRLIAIILLINVLGYMMRECGQMDRALVSLRFLGPKYIIATIPFLFGLMPMPGGALVSAPIIEPECNKLRLAPERKTFLNMWFRHTIFFIFPLSNAIILTSELSGYSVYSIILHQMPFFFVSVLLGIHSMRDIPNVRDKSRVDWSFLWHLSPILLVIALNLFLDVDFILGLLCAIALVFVQNKSRDWRMALRGLSLPLAVAIVGIMAFRFTIERTDTASFLLGALPSQILVFAIPFIMGALTGLNLASIGISFPILGALVASPADVVAVYVASTLGYVASPLHLCLIVTCEYFKSTLGKYYRLAIPALLVLLALEMAYVFLS